MINVSHQPPSEIEEQSCVDEVPLREETPQEQSSPKDSPPVDIADDEEEAKANKSPPDDEQVCTFKIWDFWAKDINRGWAIILKVDPSSETVRLIDI